MADSSVHRRQQPRERSSVVTELRPVPRTPAERVTDRGSSRSLRLLICVLFLGSSVISLTGLMFFLTWIAAL